MDPVTLVRDIMTTEVVTTSPEASVLSVSKIFSERHYNGLPVVDKNGVLVGLITQYNLISTESLLQMPTLEKIAKTVALILLSFNI